ncbi:MAG: type II secretion system F family protein [Candidatus Micrarchaeota archaeon]|nr:type II secretion system F family protein [Candidatus Micrarchaeota archaeon]
MQIKRIPLMLLPISSGRTLGTRFKGLGNRIVAFYPSIRYDLRDIGVDLTAEQFGSITLISALGWAFVFTILSAVLIGFSASPLPIKIMVPFLAFIVSLLLFMVLHLAYPKMIAETIAKQEDRELIFVMRDVLIQISSGIPLFTVIENVGNTGYDYIGPEFREVAARVRGGAPLLDELEAMAIRTRSAYLKKTTWQLVTAIRSGANLTATLKSIVNTLVEYQFSLSRSFNAELNFIILIYLMAAAVLPTIGTTVLVIFSVFGLLGVSPELFVAVVGLSFIGQIVIIGYVKTKRPNLFI